MLDNVCLLDGDLTAPPAGPEPDDPPSPGFSCEDNASPLEPSPFHSTLFMPQDDLPVPPDFQLRQSSVPGVGVGLGIWAQRTVDMGERFGPYPSEQQTCLREPTRDWEVGNAGPVGCLSEGSLQL
ncbi:hypothetical protein DPEC_G00241690 [Dallia pectoralis]|uniref:Uncharacterized protein n=1 Tax=Dallia pectoralis TaxID=75939 RepID=A0ACC2FV26_DALPE|nr:hypothetical protein DPEC_G00241690 [Dallia pectoralis]